MAAQDHQRRDQVLNLRFPGIKNITSPEPASDDGAAAAPGGRTATAEPAGDAEAGRWGV